MQGEFLEMPGLRLTAAQARRLWGLDAATWRDGAFMRFEHARPAKATVPPLAAGVNAA